MEFHSCQWQMASKVLKKHHSSACTNGKMMVLNLSYFLENWGSLKAERPYYSLESKEARTYRVPVSDTNLCLCYCKFKEIPQLSHSMQRDLSVCI